MVSRGLITDFNIHNDVMPMTSPALSRSRMSRHPNASMLQCYVNLNVPPPLTTPLCCIVMARRGDDN